MSVTLAPEAESNGLALLLHGLVAGNLEAAPERRADLAALRGDVAITARDDDSSVEVTLSFGAGGLVVRDGVVGRPAVHVTAAYDDVLLLSQLPVRHGLPNVFSETGRTLLGKILKGDVTIAGLFLHPLALVRLTRLVSVDCR